MGTRLLLVCLAALLTAGEALGADGYRAALDDVLRYYERFDDHERMAAILLTEVTTRPHRTAELLERATRSKLLHAHLETKRLLKVVIDNGLSDPLDVVIAQQRSFSVPGLHHRVIELPPSPQTFIFACPAQNFIDELSIPLISPPTTRDHLIINVGKRNSYVLTGYDVQADVRIPDDGTIGWPRRLEKPAYFWFALDELFPPLPSRVSMRARPLRSRPPRFVTVLRIRPPGIH